MTLRHCVLHDFRLLLSNYLCNSSRRSESYFLVSASVFVLKFYSDEIKQMLLCGQSDIGGAVFVKSNVRLREFLALFYLRML